MPRSTLIILLCPVVLFWPRHAVAQDNPFASCKSVSVVNALGQVFEPVPERPDALRARLTGSPVTVICDETSVTADVLTYEPDTGKIVATGRVAFQQPSLVIYAQRAELNRWTKLGTFYDATGSARIGDQPAQRDRFGTMEPDVTFHGEEISRVGLTTYRIRGGGFSTCAQATPRWQMTAAGGTIVLDKRVVMKNVVLRVKDVPLLYLPGIYYPINKEDRATGFLLPSYGNSLGLGSSLSNAFFWAISRSQDATFFHDWSSKGGQGIGSEYRYSGTAGSSGRGTFYTGSEPKLQASATSSPRYYQIDGNANQALPNNFRLFGRLNYFTNIRAQQRSQDVADYSRRDRSFNATLSGAVGAFRLLAVAEQADYFYGSSPGQRTGRLPTVNLSLAPRPLGRSKVYVGASSEVGYLVRQLGLGSPDAEDRSLWRFDASPTIRAPLSTLPFLTATGSASWHVTHWLESLDPVLGQVPVALTRQLLDLQAQVVGPVFSRVFQTPENGYADRFKHLIEPGFGIQRTSAFDAFDRVVKNDYLDQQVGGTTNINYRLTNRLLARRHGAAPAPGAPATPGVAREILSVDIGQTYYSQAQAAFADPQYESGGVVPSESKGTFSPIQITTLARPSDVGSARFQMEIDSKYKALRSMNASGTLESAWADLTMGWRKTQVIKGLPGFDVSSHFLNALTAIRLPRNRIGGEYSLNYDVGQNVLNQQRIVAYYNSQCCGVAFDWQTRKTPLLGLPADRQFNISFTLAGIGSFSNPFGSFGGK
ncbi:MAG: putative LPS assembly protein LptD [Vicinamibacterales bacterium]